MKKEHGRSRPCLGPRSRSLLAEKLSRCLLALSEKRNYSKWSRALEMVRLDSCLEFGWSALPLPRNSLTVNAVGGASRAATSLECEFGSWSTGLAVGHGASLPVDSVYSPRSLDGRRQARDRARPPASVTSADTAPGTRPDSRSVRLHLPENGAAGPLEEAGLEIEGGAPGNGDVAGGPLDRAASRAGSRPAKASKAEISPVSSKQGTHSAGRKPHYTASCPGS